MGIARKAAGVLVGLVALAVIGVVAVFALAQANGTSVHVSEAASDTSVSSTNAAIDSTGVQATAQDVLLAHAREIAQATGLATSQVQSIIKNLSLESWEVATLPADAVEKATVSGSYAGVSASLVLYEDPSYVTVQAYDQTITLSVPSEAQQYLPMLAYAG